MELSAETKNEIRKHVLACNPCEACGLIVDGEYFPCENTVKNEGGDPRMDFLIGASEYLAAEKKGAIQAVIHSHVGQRVKSASKKDMESQQEMKIPWGISFVNMGLCSDPIFFGDEVPIAPLEGREFIHGIYDCWTLARDYLRLNKHGVCLVNTPRSWGWWDSGKEDLYSIESIKGVFDSVDDIDHARPGDILFGTIRAKVINHVAVYLGKGLVLHQKFGVRSRREPLGDWVKHILYIGRYKEGGNAQ